MNILELFAGSRSIGTEAESRGHNVFSVDWSDFPGINLQMDIEQLRPEMVPFVPNMVWASPDCRTYSIAAISHHRKGTEPLSDYAKKCDSVNRHFIRLIHYYQTINPKLVYFIENPRGMFRKMPFVADMDRKTVWYCKYEDERAKPTDIFTNSPQWQPRPLCHNGNPDCHHQRAPRGAKTGTQGRTNDFERSKIPHALCAEILDSIT